MKTEICTDTHQAKCLWCERDLESPEAQDFVVPGIIGARSLREHQCGYCEAEFTAERISGVQIKFKLIRAGSSI